MRHRFAFGWIAGLIVLSCLACAAEPRRLPSGASAPGASGADQRAPGAATPSSPPALAAEPSSGTPESGTGGARNASLPPAPSGVVDAASVVASPTAPPDSASSSPADEGAPGVGIGQGTAAGSSSASRSGAGNAGSSSVPADAVPILMYHYIRVNPVPTDKAGFNLSVTPSDFAAQMSFLAENGFTTVTMAQVRAYVRNGTPLPPHPVALTFDDGYDDAYTAARPVLEAHHMTATFYLITGFVDHPRYLTWNQAVALDREGMEIGSHTVHHYGLPYIAPVLRISEIDNSRADLEYYLGHPILDFCYPSGEVNPSVELTVAQAGYLTATTTASGAARPTDDPLRLPRLRIWGGMPLKEFSKVLGVTH